MAPKEGYCYFKDVDGTTVELPTSMRQLMRESKAGRELATVIKVVKSRGAEVPDAILSFVEKFEKIIYLEE